MRTEVPIAAAVLSTLLGFSAAGAAAPCLTHGDGESGFDAAVQASSLVLIGRVHDSAGRVFSVDVQQVYRGTPDSARISVGPESPELLYGADCMQASDEVQGAPAVFLLQPAPHLSPALNYQYAFADSVFGYSPLGAEQAGWLSRTGLRPEPLPGAPPAVPPLGQRIGVVVVIAVIAGIFIAGSLLLMLGARQRHISESGG